MKRILVNHLEPVEADASAILPIVRNRRILSQIERMDFLPASIPVMDPLLADLVVLYAFELEAGYKLVNLGDCRRLRLRLDGLCELATRNLSRRVAPLPADWDVPVMRIVAGQQLEPSLLLLEDYWDHLAAQTSGELLVTIPNVDALHVSGTAVSGGGEPALRSLHCMKPIGSDSEHLSNHVLAWRNHLWEVLLPNRTPGSVPVSFMESADSRSRWERVPIRR